MNHLCRNSVDKPWHCIECGRQLNVSQHVPYSAWAPFEGKGLLATNEQCAQLRDLLRCVAWIRDLQLNGSPKTFDANELFRDFNRAYGTHQLEITCDLFTQLDEYCKTNQIPPMQWKMEAPATPWPGSNPNKCNPPDSKGRQ